MSAHVLNAPDSVMLMSFTFSSRVSDCRFFLDVGLPVRSTRGDAVADVGAAAADPKATVWCFALAPAAADAAAAEMSIACRVSQEAAG